jgi:hypothetical protein
MALYASYSLHYVGGVGPSDISADYYAVFCDRIQQLLEADRHDPPFVAMMSNGTSGNINNIDFSKVPEKRPPYEKMKEASDRIAQAALAAWKKMEWKEWVPLKAEREFLEIGIRHPTAEQLARAEKILAQHKPDAIETLEEIYAARAVAMNRWPMTIPLPLQALRIGEVAIGGIPAEVFVETGLAFKAKSPFKPSFIVELNNGYYGYMPTSEQHALGGYETWLGTNRLEVEASTKILDRLLDMVKSLR